MPERLTTADISKMVGSGPHRCKADERRSDAISVEREPVRLGVCYDLE